MATARMYGRGMDRRRVPEGSPGSPAEVERLQARAQAALDASGVELEELDERELPATNASGAAVDSRRGAIAGSEVGTPVDVHTGHSSRRRVTHRRPGGSVRLSPSPRGNSVRKHPQLCSSPSTWRRWKICRLIRAVPADALDAR